MGIVLGKSGSLWSYLASLPEPEMQKTLFWLDSSEYNQLASSSEQIQLLPEDESFSDAVRLRKVFEQESTKYSAGSADVYEILLIPRSDFERYWEVKAFKGPHFEYRWEGKGRVKSLVFYTKERLSK